MEKPEQRKYKLIYGELESNRVYSNIFNWKVSILVFFKIKNPNLLDICLSEPKIEQRRLRMSSLNSAVRCQPATSRKI
jgi:hypothetical protein